MLCMNPKPVKNQKMHLYCSNDLQGLAGDDIDGIHRINARLVHVDLQIFATECFPVDEFYNQQSHIKPL